MRACSHCVEGGDQKEVIAEYFLLSLERRAIVRQVMRGRGSGIGFFKRYVPSPSPPFARGTRIDRVCFVTAGRGRHVRALMEEGGRACCLENRQPNNKAHAAAGMSEKINAKTFSRYACATLVRSSGVAAVPQFTHLQSLLPPHTQTLIGRCCDLFRKRAHSPHSPSKPSLLSVFQFQIDSNRRPDKLDRRART